MGTYTEKPIRPIWLILSITIPQIMPIRPIPQKTRTETHQEPQQLKQPQKPDAPSVRSDRAFSTG